MNMKIMTNDELYKLIIDTDVSQDIRRARFNTYREENPHQKISFAGTNFEDMDIDLSHMNLAGVDLSGTKFKDANFIYASLSCADFSQARFTRVNFNSAICIDTDFMECICFDASFNGANLAGANFRKVTFQKISMKDAHTSGAKFHPKEAAMIQVMLAHGIRFET